MKTKKYKKEKKLSVPGQKPHPRPIYSPRCTAQSQVALGSPSGGPHWAATVAVTCASSFVPVDRLELAVTASHN